MYSAWVPDCLVVMAKGYSIVVLICTWWYDVAVDKFIGMLLYVSPVCIIEPEGMRT